jgi:acyl-[acyl-carrier-protein]-phospholipid O-acyltransferase / long-chain-fatty-acid--[acyl-carrier-protein] ligase
MDLAKAKTSLFGALLDARTRFGGKRAIAVDGDERELTYDEIVRAAFALGSALRRGTEPGDTLGVMLPTGVGSVIAVFALSAYGRVPAMLNFTAGVPNIHAAMTSAKVKRIVTAHRFIKLGKLENLVEALSASYEFIYLEDVREKLTLMDKAAAAVGQFIPDLIRATPRHDATAVILFTSGTEGEPKGVALSHFNLLTNVEQVRAHIDLHETDVLFNPLPTFHSFGLTVGVLMPLYLGIQTVLHPTPRQPHEIVRRIAERKATILLSTDTFVSQYARVADGPEFDTLRLAVCGAERVRAETRTLMRRFGKTELLEGYGVTETSPVLAANQPGANREGTVGRLVHGVEARVDPIEGISGAGRLFVRGPNIMLGYLRPEAPGEIQPPADGWHDTGDVVAIDNDGFIAIRGRLKRFAKIGGESVSLTAVENCASALWPDHHHAAIAVPDGRKGEQIVLVSTYPDANRGQILAWMQDHGVPELAAPRTFKTVSEIPLMATGKTDYVAVTKLIDAHPR